jgi:hypothetical protein
MPRRHFSVVAGGGLTVQREQAAAWDLGTRRELFVDRERILEMKGTELRAGTPLDAGTALKLDRPWEGRFSGYSTLVRTERGFLLRHFWTLGRAWKRARGAKRWRGFTSRVWPAAEGQYVLYYRSWKEVNGVRYRWVSRATSDDFMNWRMEGGGQLRGGAGGASLHEPVFGVFPRAPVLHRAGGASSGRFWRRFCGRATGWRTGSRGRTTRR